MAVLVRTFIFLIFFILTGDAVMHERFDEFEIRPDPTADYGISSP